MTAPRRPLFAAVREYVVAEGYRTLPPDDLWAKVRDGPDEQAFRVVLERFGPRVFACCRAILRDEHLAEEAFQDTFRLLIRKRAAIPTYAAAGAWLYQTATNTARSLRRGWWRRTRREVPLTGGEPATAQPPQLEASDAVSVALADLPDKYRRPLELVYWDGLTHTEAGAVLGLPAATVSTRVSRGLARLRERLGNLAPAAVAGTGLEVALAAPAPAVDLDRLIGPSLTAWLAGGGGIGWRLAGGWVLGLVAAGGAVTAVGLAWGRNPSLAISTPPTQRPVVEETVPERNLRLYHSQVWPAQQAALVPYAAGGVKLDWVGAADTRVRSEMRLGLGPDGPWLQFIIVFDTLTGSDDTFLYPVGQQAREFRPGQVLFIPLPWLNTEVRVPSDPMVAAVRAFDRLPRDDRTVAEGRRYEEAVSRVLGDWRVRGGGGRSRVVRNGPGNIGLIDPDGRTRWCAGWIVQVDATGRVSGIAEGGRQFVFSADGRRVDFPGTDEWWERPPTDR